MIEIKGDDLTLSGTGVDAFIIGDGTKEACIKVDSGKTLNLGGIISIDKVFFEEEIVK